MTKCRDCSEGKCGACIGSAFVERGPDIDEVACECDGAGHRAPSLSPAERAEVARFGIHEELHAEDGM